MSDERRVRIEDGGAGVVRLTLDRPARRNALDDRTVAELEGALSEAEARDDARVVLLRGDGPDFCAGADLAQLEALETSGPLENLRDAQRLGDLIVHMRRSRLVIVAAVHGHAFAGGAGLATAADVVLAAEDATFGYPEIRLGFVPAMVMALLRRAVGEKVAFDLITSGEPITAVRARELGLVTRVLPPDGFDDASAAFARELAGRSASALHLCKRLLYGMDGLSFEDAIGRGAEVNVLARMTPDTRAGVRAFLEKRGSGGGSGGGSER